MPAASWLTLNRQVKEQKKKRVKKRNIVKGTTDPRVEFIIRAV